MKTDCLAPEILVQLSTFTAEQLGLHFPPQRWRDLEKGLKAAAPELGFADEAVLAEYLLSTPITKDLLEVWASHITIGETYFFREKGIFEALEWQILPQLIGSRRLEGRRLRIWSAGCASGEEAYSIAILLHKILPDLLDWRIMVLATDVSQRALQKAEEGVYTQWSFRGTPAWLVEKYFNRVKGDRWEIMPWIKEMVTFSYLNLAADPFPSLINNTSALDIIFCRNVLMYFTPAVVNRVVEGLSAALVEGGWLIVSPAEYSLLQDSCLSACPYPGAIPFQKSRQPDQYRVSRIKESTAGSNYRQFQDQTKVIPHLHPIPSNGEGIIKERIFGNSSNSPQAMIPGKTGSNQVFGQGPEFPPLKGNDRAKDRAKPRYLEESAGLLVTGSYEEAVAKVQRALTEENDDAGAMARLAKLYANQGKLEEAQIMGEKAISRDRLNPRNYYLLASILEEQSRGAEAVALLKQTLYLDYEFVLAHFSLGNLAMRQHHFKEAEKHFDNVLALLAHSPNEEIVPASEGLTTGALREVVSTIKHRLAEKKFGRCQKFTCEG